MMISTGGMGGLPPLAENLLNAASPELPPPQKKTQQIFIPSPPHQ